MSGERVAVTLDEALRETVAHALWDEGAWAGECCDHDDYRSCDECQRVCRTYADAVLAVLREKGTQVTERWAIDPYGANPAALVFVPGQQPTPSGEGT